MKIDREFTKTLQFDPEKANETFKKLVEVFKEQKLTVGEILIVTGNLVYNLGASIDGYKGKGPGIYEEIQEEHKKAPTPGAAMMLTGLDISSWYEDWERIQTTDNQENSEE